MIHAFALEPDLVATWARRSEFLIVHDKFGVGTPRVMLEIPAFSEWKDAVSKAASELELEETDWTRLVELLKLFSEHRCRRADAAYDEVVTWLENAEREYDRQEFRAIVAESNPRRHRGVMLGRDLGAAKAKSWTCDSGATVSRSPQDIAAALSAMLVNCKALHLVDPYFGPENARHRKILEALMGVLCKHGSQPDVIRVHCGKRSELSFFEEEASRMATRLPAGVSVEFARWSQRLRGEKLHNRYVLTDLGGVSLGVGLDEGEEGETDDVLLLPRAQYERRWEQFVSGPIAFDSVDTPKTVLGTKRPRQASRRR